MNDKGAKNEAESNDEDRGMHGRDSQTHTQLYDLMHTTLD